MSPVFCVSGHFLFGISTMGDMNGTFFPTLAVNQLQNRLNISRSSWQTEALKGVQITVTLLIFLVRLESISSH